jgi:hypothetical protein
MSRFIPKIVALAAAAILLAACGSVAEKATETMLEQATGTDIEMSDEGFTISDGESSMTVDTEGGNVTMTDESGTSTFQSGEGAELPAGFPSDFPAPAGGTLTTAADMPDGIAVMWGFDTYSGDQFNEYVAQIKAAGYAVAEEATVVDSGGSFQATASFSKGGRNFAVAGMGAADFGQVSVFVTNESP